MTGRADSKMSLLSCKGSASSFSFKLEDLDFFGVFLFDPFWAFDFDGVLGSADMMGSESICPPLVSAAFAGSG